MRTNQSDLQKMDSEHIDSADEELIEIDRYEYDSRKMILTESDRLDIMKSGTTSLTNEQRLSRLFNYIRTQESREFRNLLSEDKSVINMKFNNTYLLHEACRKGAIDVVTFLLFSDADCHIRDENGHYPQHAAAQSNCPILIDILNVFGHDMNVKDSDGNTPLHHAVVNEDAHIIHMLMNLEAPMSKNNEGFTPIDICQSREIIETLLKYQTVN